MKLKTPIKMGYDPFLYGKRGGRQVQRWLGILYFFVGVLGGVQVQGASNLPSQRELRQRSLLHMIDYIGLDYGKAISHGVILSEAEFAELVDFTATAPQLFAALLPEIPRPSPEILHQIEQGFGTLQRLVQEKQPQETVLSHTQSLQTILATVLQVDEGPAHAPSWEAGQQIYRQHCASCHGTEGDGRGPASQGMTPPPFDFTQKEAMALRSPTSLYNAVLAGVSGTSMPSFADLPQRDLWDVSFFLVHFATAGTPDPSGGAVEGALLRTLQKIDQAEEAFDQQQFLEADHRLLDAYLEGFEPAEARLGSTISLTLVRKIEAQFLHARTYARKGNQAAFVPAVKDLRDKIDESLGMYQAVVRISMDRTPTPWGDFWGSFLIILREGFEAFLIIMALLTLLANVGARHAQNWVHAGWICAVVAGFVAYFIMEGVLHLSGSAKESVEAVITGAAVILLLYTGFWLLHQAESCKWRGFLQKKTHWALGNRSLWYLFGISFVAVFREAAETVLFYAALFSTAHHRFMVGMGFVAGVAVLGVLGTGIVRYNIRIPMRQFFLCTSSLMLVLAVILAGKTVFELMEAGYIQPTPVVGFPTVDLLGLYPARESLLTQGILLGLCMLVGVGLSLQKRRCGAEKKVGP